MPLPDRPVIALDIKLKHHRTPETNEVVGGGLPDQLRFQGSV